MKLSMTYDVKNAPWGAFFFASFPLLSIQAVQ